MGMTAQTLIAAVGLISTIAFSSIALILSVRNKKQSNEQKNLEGVFDASATVVKNLLDDNSDLRERNRMLTKRVSDLELGMSEVRQDMQRKIDQVTSERNELSHKLLEAEKTKALLNQQLEGGTS